MVSPGSVSTPLTAPPPGAPRSLGDERPALAGSDLPSKAQVDEPVFHGLVADIEALGEERHDRGICGRRILQELLRLVSFDTDNGSPVLSSLAVERAQARIAGYAMRLAEAASFLAPDAKSIRVDEVFYAAGVPLASNLRARRLGLVALVARRLGTSLRGHSTVDIRTLIEDAFADRWAFPQVRAALSGAYPAADRSWPPGV